MWTPQLGYYFVFFKYIDLTLVNYIIYVSGIQFYNTIICILHCALITHTTQSLVSFLSPYIWSLLPSSSSYYPSSLLVTTIMLYVSTSLFCFFLCCFCFISHLWVQSCPFPSDLCCIYFDRLFTSIVTLKVVYIGTAIVCKSTFAKAETKNKH